jgi:uracil-DNA glycosylase family 4
VIHVYAVEHRPPDPRAPEAHTTYASPREASREEIAHAVAEVNAEPIQAIRPFVLDYPNLGSDPAAGIEAVRQRYADCERCHLSDRRTRIVHVKGNPNAAVLVLGEGPGRKEDTAGEPFIGPAGKLQDEMFRECGIDPLREVAWITMVGCRPCNSRYDEERAPTDVEKLACSERTLLLLRALRPRVVICLGEGATSMFWSEPPAPNTWHPLRPKTAPEDWIVVGVARHPTYILNSVMKNYREYFAAKLFLRRLRRRMNGSLTKVSAWRFMPDYLRNAQPVAGG